MRILLVGSDRVDAIEHFFVKYIKELQVEVSFFAATSIFYDYYFKSIFNKIKYRAGVSTIIKEINRQFKNKVTETNPEYIWLFKGMEILPSTLQWAKDRGIKLVNYNPDNPFIFTGRGSGNKNITDALPLYDLHFTYSLEIEKQLKEKYSGAVALLPFAFDIPGSVYEDAASQPEVLKTCFLGNPDKQRVNFITQLADKNVQIDVYGNHWKDFITHKAVTVFPPVYGREFWRILARYRVQLNMMRVHNENAHNMRSFEVPAIGGIMLAPDTPEHRSFFTEGREVFLYSDADNCVSKIQYILSLPASDAAAIRRNARARSLADGYSYKDRAAAAITQITSLNA